MNNNLPIWVFMIFFMHSISHADLKSTSGDLRFLINDQESMQLNTTGLGIGVAPSANLSVNGNAMVSEKMTIGGTTLSSSNLLLQGSLGMSLKHLDADAILDQSSIYTCGNTSGNLTFYLPSASEQVGRMITIKKTTNVNRVLVISNANGGIDGQRVLILSGSSNIYPYASFVSTGTGWATLTVSGNANPSFTMFENFDDGSYADSNLFDVTASSNPTATVNKGINGSYGLNNNNDGAVAVGSTNMTIPSIAIFSLMGQAETPSNTNAGCMSVGWESSGTSYNPFFSASAGAYTALGSLYYTTGGLYAFYTGKSHNLESKDITSGATASITPGNWYRMRGSVQFDGIDTFTFDLHLDEYNSTGNQLLNSDILRGNGTYQNNIGTNARFVYQTNFGHGFKYTDNYLLIFD